MKKFLSAVLATAMVASMAVPAMAATSRQKLFVKDTTYTISGDKVKIPLYTNDKYDTYVSYDDVKNYDVYFEDVENVKDVYLEQNVTSTSSTKIDDLIVDMLIDLKYMADEYADLDVNLGVIPEFEAETATNAETAAQVKVAEAYVAQIADLLQYAYNYEQTATMLANIGNWNDYKGTLNFTGLDYAFIQLSKLVDVVDKELDAYEADLTAKIVADSAALQAAVRDVIDQFRVIDNSTIELEGVTLNFMAEGNYVVVCYNLATSAQEAIATNDLNKYNAADAYLVIETSGYYGTSKKTIEVDVEIIDDSSAGRTVLDKTFTLKLDNAKTSVFLKLSRLADIKAEDITNAVQYDKSSGDLYIDLVYLNGSLFKNAVALAGLETNYARVIDTEDAEYIELSAEGFNFATKLSNQGKLSLAYNTDEIDLTGVETATGLPINNADLTFFNFTGTPKFDYTGTVTIALPDDDVDYYLYEVKADGLYAIEVTLNNREDAYKFNARQLTSYVLSDTELVAVGEADTVVVDDTTVTVVDDVKGNPNTGSSDFVGVAVALAVVSVAAAGAVSLKRK